ncbi:hypothetical protein [Prauserella flavalba]|uniref:Uncharacterized protein n=1 Tax=Prauserella flavalba TaxID=1477506 RepID=A0A318LQ09_9PSEU|nr:hypothetical protein [Prauserella flavalba]PXY36471.1 hypothetical protein BA062_13840 [Prauserella flavalba]
MLGWLKRNRSDTPATNVPDASAGIPRWPLETWRGGLPSDGPGYLALCLTPAFPEEPEPRNLRDGEALDRIIEVARTDGSTSPAMAAVVEDLLAEPRYAALDSLYTWLAPVYRGTDRQLEVIGQGLRTCPRKYWLLDLAGIAMLQRGRGAEALYYWAHSVSNAESVGDGRKASAYDFLIVTAHVLGERGATKKFRARADQADHPQTVLDDEYTALVQRAFRKGTKAMRTVVQSLAQRIPA